VRSWGFWTLMTAGFGKNKFQNNEVTINHSRMSVTVGFVI